MTNRIALGLALVIVALALANAAFGWQAHIFLGRKLADAIHWLAFWR